MRLDLTQLRTFYESVRLGSYTAAAVRLHISQSAVSHAVAKLEQSVGRALVEWRARKLCLTDEGEALMEVCGRVFTELEEAESRLINPEQTLVRTVRLGAPVEFGSTVLLLKLSPLLEENPWLRLDFTFSHNLFEPLVRKEVDLAVDCRLHVHPELERCELFREKYVVIASPAFLAASPVHSPLDLGSLPVLSLDKQGQWWGNLLEALPVKKRPVLRRIMEINHLRGIIHAALLGLGLGLVPKYTVLEELDRGSLLSLFPRLPLLEDRFALYEHRGLKRRPGNRLVAQFMQSLDASEFGDAIGPLRARA
ncbi:MAG: LysR family transcriptional regulator [Myxococcota bacterium]|jgi:DNA-binding transcriptional LysR family regulator|nr:LysR family transcriptional regulator [Myxococcota bacterium]